MAWSTPRVWAVGEILTAANINTYISNDLSALSTHAHTGAAGDGATLASMGASANPHGASNHTDRTRTLWLPASLWSLDSGTRVTNGSTPNQYDAIQFANAATQGAYIMFLMPSDAVTGTVDLRVVYAGDGTATNDVKLQIDAKAQADGAGVISGAGTTGSPAVTVVTTADWVNISPVTALALASVAALSLVRVHVERLGSNGADTYAGNFFFIGAAISYTSDE